MIAVRYVLRVPNEDGLSSIEPDYDVLFVGKMGFSGGGSSGGTPATAIVTEGSDPITTETGVFLITE